MKFCYKNLKEITQLIKTITPQEQLKYLKHFCDLELNRTFERIKEILSFLKANNKKNVLDIGCGTGHVISYLSNTEFIKGIGVSLEKSFDIWRVLKSKYEVEFLCARGEKLPFKENIFDAVILFGVLEHIGEDINFIDKEEYDIRFLKEVRRVLKKDGLVFIYNIPNKNSLTENLCKILRIWHHPYKYTLSQLKNKITKSGFKIIKLYTRGILPTLKLGNLIKNKFLIKFYNKMDYLLSQFPLIRIFSQNYNIILIRA